MRVKHAHATGSTASTEEVEDADTNEIGRLAGSAENLRDDVAMHVGEPEIQAL